MFYTVWWPRPLGDDSLTPPTTCPSVEKEFLVTMRDDLEIWR